VSSFLTRLPPSSLSGSLSTSKATSDAQKRVRDTFDRVVWQSSSRLGSSTTPRVTRRAVDAPSDTENQPPRHFKERSIPLRDEPSSRVTDHDSLRLSRVPHGAHDLMLSTASYRAHALDEDSLAYGTSQAPIPEDRAASRSLPHADDTRDGEVQATSVRRSPTLSPPPRPHSTPASVQRTQQLADLSHDRQRLDRVLNTSRAGADRWQRDADIDSAEDPISQQPKNNNADDAESFFSFGIPRNVAPGTSWLHEARSNSSGSRSFQPHDTSTSSTKQSPRPHSRSNSRASSRGPSAPPETRQFSDKHVSSESWLEKQVRSIEEAETTRDLARLEEELQPYLSVSRQTPRRSRRREDGEYDADADSDAFSDVQISSSANAPTRTPAVPYDDSAPNWRQSPATPYMPGYLRGLNTPASSSRRRAPSFDEEMEASGGRSRSLASRRPSLPNTPHPPGHLRSSASYRQSPQEDMTTSPIKSETGTARSTGASGKAFSREF
jgi:hypothetical protein